VSKPEWGIQRTCQSCYAFFYDMKKDPITCPKCLTVYDEKSLLENHHFSHRPDDEMENENLQDGDDFEEDEFFLDTPTELLESLEDIEEDLDGKKSLQI
jgi:uncharacterized protein (TIGR02300 family)